MARPKPTLNQGHVSTNGMARALMSHRLGVNIHPDNPLILGILHASNPGTRSIWPLRSGADMVLDSDYGEPKMQPPIF